MCDNDDIKIDVSYKPDSINMAKFWWKWMFGEIAKDYPGYNKVKILYFEEEYTLKGLLVDGDNPEFLEEMTSLTDIGFSYFIKRKWDNEKNYDSDDNEAPF
mgnify:CR=1 FL=1